MMDHLRERWEYIRDFVNFDGIIRCSQESIQDAIDSEYFLFPTCDEYLGAVGQESLKNAENQVEFVTERNFDQRPARS